MKKTLHHQFKRTLCLFLVLITTLSTMVLPVSAASAPLPGIYVFYSINKYTNMNTLYKEGAGAAIGIDYADGEENEFWALERVGTTEYFTLQPLHQKNCYLSAVNGKGNGLTLEEGVPSSKYCHWKANYVDNGQVVITSRAYPSLAIDCTNGHIDTLGNPYILWDKNGYDQAQSFYCVRVSESTTKYQPSHRASPGQTTCAWGASADPSMVVNSQYAEGEGASIVLDNLSSPAEKNETVTLVPRGNNLYSMHFAHSPNTAIAASDIFTDSPITLKKFRADDPMCLWQVFQVGSGYSFRNAGNFLMLDNYCHGTRPGNLQISYSYTGGDPQVYFAKNVSAASSNSSSVSSAEAAVLQRLEAMMNGSYGNGVYKLNTRYNGTYAKEECKGFAKDTSLGAPCSSFFSKETFCTG